MGITKAPWPGPDSTEIDGGIHRVGGGVGRSRAYLLMIAQDIGEGVSMRLVFGPALTPDRIDSLAARLMPPPGTPAEDLWSIEVFELNYSLASILTLDDGRILVRTAL